MQSIVRLFAAFGFMAAASAVYGQTTIISGGDPADGLTVDPAHVVAAWNLGTASATTYTLQGVTFTNIAGGGNYGVSFDFGGAGNDAAISGLMQSLAWSGVSGSLDYDFTGLTPGGNYFFQLFQTVGGSYGGRHQGISINGAPATYMDVTGSLSLTTLSATADGLGNLHLTMARSGAFGDGSGTQDGAVLNALVLTAVPEPATYAAILGAGALGLAFFRRRTS
ncbi:MAG: hypothetical protein JWQ62_2351 [Lacunisphaera sp.]|nr:hypothetical protein [Lacunisphaera sp.]